MSSLQKRQPTSNAQQKSFQQQQKAPINIPVQKLNFQSQHNTDQSPPINQNLSGTNQKWQKIISEQTEDESIPFILKQQSFKSQNPKQQFHRQKSMMQSTAKIGRELLTQKNYHQASKQLSKTLMAFQFIAKNYAQTIQKEILKEMMIQTVLPAYNNLALCYLKLKNYELVMSFTNQVLAQDDGNIKARYRRALASKELKNTEQAIKDLQIVKKMDSQMTNYCNEKIKQCKNLEIEIRKKRKLAAQKFISGYQSDDIKTAKNKENQITGERNSQKFEEQIAESFNLMSWIKQKCQKCSKLLQKLRPGSSESSKKGE